jgi:hypothetical protein
MGYVTSLQNGMVRWSCVFNSLEGYKGAPKRRQLITNQHGVIFQETEVSVKDTVMPTDDMRQFCSNSTAELVRRDKQYIFMPSRSLFNLLLIASVYLTINRDSSLSSVFKHVLIFFLLLHRAFCYNYCFYSNSCTYIHFKITNSH